eukprot:GHVU01046597.1.p1 GENE.GHVU01046597.1~~GHVU01046597.1.p1  ORF type:complete len:157 (-),score=8.81 GHVU01046597.1:1-471(-)
MAFGPSSLRRGSLPLNPLAPQYAFLLPITAPMLEQLTYPPALLCRLEKSLQHHHAAGLVAVAVESCLACSLPDCRLPHPTRDLRFIGPSIVGTHVHLSLQLLSRALTAPSAVSKEEAGVFWKGDVGSGQLLVNLRLSSSAELTPVPSLYPVVRFIP